IIMASDPIVNTRYGSIRGFEFRSERGFETEVFLGVPFAKPPVGELRFEKPQPPIPWEGVLEAKTPKPPCIAQPNIFNPNVMFYIHGGDFLFGSADDVNYKAADRIVSKGVILIAVQYRLGVLGFYTTGDDVVP
ncbi:hypothetical protein FO519_010954, partial [Halicephalobus sp. NKZ332]